MENGRCLFNEGIAARDERNVILGAMNFIFEYSCIRFHPRKKQHVDFVDIQNKPNEGYASACSFGTCNKRCFRKKRPGYYILDATPMWDGTPVVTWYVPSVIEHAESDSGPYV